MEASRVASRRSLVGAAASRSVTSASTRVRSGSSGMRSTISRANAYVRMPRAACSGTPRERR